MSTRLMLLARAVLAGVSACDRRGGEDDAPVATATFDPAAWRPPADSEIPADSLGAAIRRGQALVLHTPDTLPAAAPLTGSHARFPKYMDRTGAVIRLADRVPRRIAGARTP